MVPLNHDIHQLYDVIVACALELAQIAQGSYFAAEEVSGDFIIDGGEVDALDGHLEGWVIVAET